jgi:hypothetical protein
VLAVQPLRLHSAQEELQHKTASNECLSNTFDDYRCWA